jgi:phage terminase large subunit-like protein
MVAFNGLEGPVDFLTLGWGIIDWLQTNLAMPDGKGGPLRLTNEQARIILELYRVDMGPIGDLRRRYRRAAIMTPKGWGTSPLLAMLTAAECLADVLPVGLDEEGNVIGEPWHTRRTVYGQVAAVSERQTGNVWNVLTEMLEDGEAINNIPGLEVYEGFIRLPYRGKIEFITSAPTSAEGEKPVIVVMDQTEAWFKSNGGKALANTLRRNAAKVGGITIEGPNAFTPGDESVAEDTFQDYQKILEGKSRSKGVLMVYREAPEDTDLSDRDSLLRGLAAVYGDAGAWNDFDRLIEEIWDTSTDPDDARRFYLNQMTQATDAWLARNEWMACYQTRADSDLADGEIVTLGFDGSRKREKGVTDATVLVACRVSDGKLFEVASWEQPDGPDAKDWEIPMSEVDLVVRDSFRRFNVVAFFGDPARWESYMDTWEADFGAQLKVKAGGNHPIRFWVSGAGLAKFIQALRRFHDAVLDKELIHAGDPVLTRHILNSRRRSTRYGLSIAKATPDSPNKIDGAIAAVLAYEARNRAIADGVLNEAQAPKKSKRLIRF